MTINFEAIRPFRASITKSTRSKCNPSSHRSVNDAMYFLWCFGFILSPFNMLYSATNSSVPSACISAPTRLRSYRSVFHKLRTQINGKTKVGYGFRDCIVENNFRRQCRQAMIQKLLFLILRGVRGKVGPVFVNLYSTSCTFQREINLLSGVTDDEHSGRSQ